MFNSLTTFDFFPSLPLGVTKLDGADNRQFLQGQLTCELDSLTTSHSQLGAHCDAKGKMMASLRLIDNGNEVLALQAAENTASHLPMLTKYAVFSKVTITDSTDEFICSGLLGQNAQQWLADNYDVSLVAENDAINTDIGTVVKLDEVNGPRILVVSNKEQNAVLTQAISNTQAQSQPTPLWQALDCVSGTPQVTPATQAEFVPQMLNLQMIDAINFKKGCYIGQETVARMHFRGLNKRGMFILQSSSHIDCNVGDNVEKQLGENWRNAGIVVSVAHVNEQTIACAVLPTDFELSESVRVKDNVQGTFTVTKPAYFAD